MVSLFLDREIPRLFCHPKSGKGKADCPSSCQRSNYQKPPPYSTGYESACGIGLDEPKRVYHTRAPVGVVGPYPAFRGLRANAEHVTLAASHETGKENAMTEEKPDAVYYLRG
jgi:hypothetical protein